MDTQSVIRAFQDTLGVEVEFITEAPFGYGHSYESVSGVASNGESEWVVYEDENDAERAAIEDIKNMIEMEGYDVLNRDFVERYITVTDTDARMIAQDIVDSRLEDVDKDELFDLAEDYMIEIDGLTVDELIASIEDFFDVFEDANFTLSDFEFPDDSDTVSREDLFDQDVNLTEIGNALDEVGNYFSFEFDPFLQSNYDKAISLVDDKDYFSEEDIDFLIEYFTNLEAYMDVNSYAGDELVDDVRDQVEDQMMQSISGRIKADPVGYFVEEEGMYSVEDLMNQSFVFIDDNELAKDAVETDGIAHFLDNYDGEGEEIIDPETGNIFIAYGTN